jgi:hypothetical protein
MPKNVLVNSLRSEVKTAEYNADTAEELAHLSSASERMGKVLEWRVAKEELRVAKRLLAEAIGL